MKIDVNRLELAMRYRGLSNKEAASAAGIQATLLSRIKARGSCSPATGRKLAQALGSDIIIHAIEHDLKSDLYKVSCREALYCPLCGGRLSGYDTRRRHVVDAAGNTYWLLLQRYRCLDCEKLHLAAPAFIAPRKHYQADVIAEAKAGHFEMCPADNSTIRRWRR